MPALLHHPDATRMMSALAQPFGDATAPEHSPEPSAAIKGHPEPLTPSHHSPILSTSLHGTEALPYSPSHRGERGQARRSPHGDWQVAAPPSSLSLSSPPQKVPLRFLDLFPTQSRPETPPFSHAWELHQRRKGPRCHRGSTSLAL
jgi:hypothetical protein